MDDHPKVCVELEIKPKEQDRNLYGTCERLVKQYARNKEKNVDKVVLSPVPRLGHGGSLAVLYMNIHNTENDAVKKLIVKFLKKKEADNEYRAAAPFGTISPGLGLIDLEEDPNSEYTIIIYKRADKKTEFRNFFLEQTDIDECCKSLMSFYRSKNFTSYIKVRPKKNQVKTLIEDYRKYLEDRKNRPLHKLKSMERFVDSGLSGVAENPYPFYMNELRPRLKTLKVPARLVHGDLHARNLMVDPDGHETPELIDYAWGHYGHWAKDFVLLESTIKYMLLSEYNFQHASNDSEKYIPLEIFKDFERQLCTGGMHLTTYQPARAGGTKKSLAHINTSLARAFRCLKTIRDNARELFEKEKCPFSSLEGEYFTSLFLVSLGQLAFPTVEPIWILHGCGLLIPEIKRSWNYNGKTV